MRPRLKTIRYNGDHRLAFVYEDGLVAELNFGHYVTSRNGLVIEPLRDEVFFAQAFIDHGVLTWPNGYDVCPDVLRAWCEDGRILRPEEIQARLGQAETSSAQA